MSFDQNERPSAAEALLDPWFTKLVKRPELRRTAGIAGLDPGMS